MIKKGNTTKHMGQYGGYTIKEVRETVKGKTKSSSFGAYHGKKLIFGGMSNVEQVKAEIDGRS